MKTTLLLLFAGSLVAVNTICASEDALLRRKRQVEQFFDQFPSVWNGAASPFGPPSRFGRGEASPLSYSDSPLPMEPVARMEPSGSSPVYETRRQSPARSMYDMVRNLFGLPFGMSSSGRMSEGRTSTSPDMRHALVSLGLIGEPQPSYKPGLFQLNDLFPDFQGTNYGGADEFSGNWWSGPNVCIEREEKDLMNNGTANATITTTTTTTVAPDTFRGEREGAPANDSTDGNSTTTKRKAISLFGGALSGGVHLQSSTCHHGEDTFACVTNVQKSDSHMRYKVTYRCCHGYKLSEITNQCSQRAPLKDISSTFKDLNVNMFSDLLRQYNLDAQLSAADKNFTVFAPQDEALQDAGLGSTNEVSEAPVNIGRDQITAILSTNLLNGLRHKADWEDEQLLPTLNANGAKIRINFYSAPTVPIVTANCARIVSANNYATNGIIHVVDSVVRPASGTVLDVLRSDSASRFTQFITLVEKFPELVKQLSASDANVTLFAPTNTAMDKARAAQPKGVFTCPRKIVEAHILPNVICSAVVGQGRVRTVNQLGNFTVFDQDVEGRVTVNGAPLAQKDLMAANGVVHALDGVIVPEEASPLTNVLQAQGSTGFSNLIRDVDMANKNKQSLALSIDAENNITIFAPNNAAVDTWNEKVLSGVSSTNGFVNNNDLVMYHIARPRLSSDDLRDEQLLETLAPASYGKLRVNFYANFPLPSVVTVNCARVLRVDRQSCGGVIHVIDRVLVPPTGNVQSWLNANSNYSTFVALAQQVDLFKTIQTQLSSGTAETSTKPVTFTLLAPNKAAFDALPKQTLDDLKKDNERLKQVLLAHVISDEVCCSGISPTSIFPVRRLVNTLDGGFISIRRSRAGFVHFGRVRANSCDNVASDGVIIGVADVVMPPAAVVTTTQPNP